MTFKPGRSGNPGGRPKRPRLSLAEAIRRGADPQELANAMIEIVLDRSHATRDRIAAFVALADRAWIKPVRRLEIAATIGPALPPEWDSLDAGARLAFLEEMRMRALQPGDDDEEAAGDAPDADREIAEEIDATCKERRDDHSSAQTISKS